MQQVADREGPRSLRGTPSSSSASRSPSQNRRPCQRTHPPENSPPGGSPCLVASRRHPAVKRNRRTGLLSSTNVKERPGPSRTVTERQETSRSVMERQETSRNAQERHGTSRSVGKRQHVKKRRSRRKRRTRSIDRAGGCACQITSHRSWTRRNRRRRPQTRRVRMCLSKIITFSRRSPSGAECRSSKDPKCERKRLPPARLRSCATSKRSQPTTPLSGSSLGYSLGGMKENRGD